MVYIKRIFRITSNKTVFLNYINITLYNNDEFLNFFKAKEALNNNLVGASFLYILKVSISKNEINQQFLQFLGQS